jgi:hypothetical protein
MEIRVAVLSVLVALASAGGVLAEVVKGPDLIATGRVVSTGNTSLVLKTDDHGHSIPFMIGTTTDVPPGVTPGSRVTVHYHAVGVDRQMADRVVLLEPRVASAAFGQAPAPAPAPIPESSPATPEEPGSTELPRTASPIPLVGLLGLTAFLASTLFRALERR